MHLRFFILKLYQALNDDIRSTCHNTGEVPTLYRKNKIRLMENSNEEMKQLINIMKLTNV